MSSIYETRNLLLEEIKHNDLMSGKHENTCKYLNYLEYLLISASTIASCVSNSAFSSLACVPIGIRSFAVGRTLFAITGGIEKYMSIIKKMKKMYEKIVLLGKDKLKFQYYWSSNC